MDARNKLLTVTRSLTPSLAKGVVAMAKVRNEPFLGGYVAAFHGLPEATQRGGPDFTRGVEAGTADRAKHRSA